jgi:ankyrin repeat protein
MSNKSVETNRRPASPFNAGRQFDSVSCAPPFLSAAVAHLWRSAQGKAMSHRNQQLLKEARKGHLERITRLLDLGADVNCRGKYGYTPLMEAASQGHVSAVHLLLGSGADPLIGADDGAPPTFFACVHGFTDVVKLLLNYGADANALRGNDCQVRPGDSKGISQLHIAISNGFAEIAIALIDAGANIDHVSCGLTPLQEATTRNMANVVERIRKVDQARTQSRAKETAEQGAPGNRLKRVCSPTGVQPSRFPAL